MGATSRTLTAFAALAGLALTATIGACAGDEEALPAASPATATPSNATPTLDPSATQPTPADGVIDPMEGTAVPVTPPAGTLDPVPENWPEFSDGGAGVIFRYPATWYTDARVSRVLSWDPATWTSEEYPASGILVEVSVTPRSDPTGTPAGSISAGLGGEMGWEVVRVYPAATAGQVRRSHAISASHGDHTFVLAAFYESDDPDNDILRQIASTFRFTK